MRTLGFFLAALVLATLGSLAFLELPYTSDDHWLIASLHAKSWREVLGVCLLGEDASAPGLFYRPLWRASFWFDANLWPNAPRVSHAVGIGWHALAIFALARLACLLSGGFDRRLGLGLGLGTAMLLAIQPAGLEAVSWVASRGDSMALFFGSLAASRFLLAQGRRDHLWGCVGLTACFASKEPGLAVAPAIAAGLVVHALRQPSSAVRVHAPWAGVCLVGGLAAAWLALRGAVLGSWLGSYPSARGSELLASKDWWMRLDMLGEVVFFGAFDGRPEELLAVSLAIVLALVLSAWRFARASDLRLPAFGLGLMLCSALLWHGVPAPGLGEPDNRFYYLPASGWIVALVGWMGTFRFERWMVRGCAWAGGLALFFALLPVRVDLIEAHQRAASSIERFYAGLHDAVEATEGPLLAIDAPGLYGPLLCGQLAFPFASSPPFGAQDPERLLGGTTAQFHDMGSLPIWAVFIALQPGGQVLRWNESSGAFESGDLSGWPTRLRARVTHAEDRGEEVRLVSANPAAPVLAVRAAADLVPADEYERGEVYEWSLLANGTTPEVELSEPGSRVEPLLSIDGTDLWVQSPPLETEVEVVAAFASRQPGWTPLGPNGLLQLAHPVRVGQVAMPEFPVKLDLSHLVDPNRWKQPGCGRPPRLWVQVLYLGPSDWDDHASGVLLSELLEVDLEQRTGLGSTTHCAAE